MEQSEKQTVRQTVEHTEAQFVDQTALSLENRLHKQAVLAAVSQSFIANDDMDVLINNALQMTGEIMDADRIMLAELDEMSLNLTIKHEIYNQRVDALKNKSLSIGFGEGSFLGAWLENNNYIANAINDVNATNYENAKILGIKSAFIIPIFTLGKFYGVLEYDKCDPYEWNDDDAFCASMISGMLAGALTRSRAEEKMAVISDFFRIISNPIFELDTGGAFIKAYSENFTFAGYHMPELVGRRLKEFIYTGDSNRILKKLHEAAYEHMHIKNMECRVISKLGETWDYTLDILPIYDAFGNLTAYRSSYNDVTEKMNKDRQLIRLKEMAEQANQAKSEFLSRMSHEIRTPMNTIIGMTTIAMRSDDPAKKQHSLEKINDASKHLLGVINDILDMSKIEANKLQLNETEFVLTKMISNVSGMISIKMAEKSQHFILNMSNEIPDNLIGDEQRLAQVIMNLLSNAVKFTPNGGEITLSITPETKPLQALEPETVQVQGLDEALDADETHTQANDELWLRVMVKDNGIGISPEQSARLFQSFEQADGSIARKFGGTGLGLAISKRIVEMMDGSIWTESEINKGSKFIFVIKLKKGIEKNIQELDEEDELDYNFDGRVLLLAEDIEINREIIIDMLEDTGVVVECAENGLEALKMYESKPGRYDLILMDVHMPEMDGYEATRRIRALKAMPEESNISEVPIIAMTASVFKEDVEKCLEAGMNDHVGKPVDTDDLLNKIYKQLVKNK